MLGILFAISSGRKAVVSCVGVLPILLPLWIGQPPEEVGKGRLSSFVDWCAAIKGGFWQHADGSEF